MMDWYVVHTKSRHERIVRDSLVQAGHSVFLPEKMAWSRRRDRRTQISIPLFPGYLFVEPSTRDHWMREVITVRSVVRVLGVDSCPIPIPRSEIDSLRILVDSGELLAPVSGICQGDRVRVEEGPFSGAEGVVVRRGRKCHLVVNISLMQRFVSVALNENILAKVS